MTTNLENLVRTIEVARTKLQLLINDDPDASELNDVAKMLDNVHVSLLNPGSPPKTAVVPDVMTLTNPVPAPQSSSSTSDFSRIRNIDEELAQKLKDAGVQDFGEIAAWTESNISEISTALGLKSRINIENWIEQAAILAKGSETEYSKKLSAIRKADKSPATTAPDTEPETKTEVETPTPEPANEPIPSAAPDQIAASEQAPVKSVHAPAASSAYGATEARIEIKTNVADQSAYSNPDEDPNEVVKRFMRALAGNQN